MASQLRREELRARFERLARRPADHVDPLEGAMLIAAEADPSFAPEDGLARLDALARDAEARIGAAESPRERVAALCRFVREAGFRGNREDYYDVRNSFLPEVLARRTGIPISLALVQLAIARHLGWPIYGVSFPGHFLLKYVDPGGGDEILIDPFDACILSEDDCRERAKVALGPEARFGPHLLRIATGRDILVRVLGNLKQLYVQRGELEEALACCDRILLLDPDAAGELRDRGLLYHQLECFEAARQDLERYLEARPADPAADALRDTLVEIRSRAERLH